LLAGVHPLVLVVAALLAGVHSLVLVVAALLAGVHSLVLVVAALLAGVHPLVLVPALLVLVVATLILVLVAALLADRVLGGLHVLLAWLAAELTGLIGLLRHVRVLLRHVLGFILGPVVAAHD